MGDRSDFLKISSNPLYFDSIQLNFRIFINFCFVSLDLFCQNEPCFKDLKYYSNKFKNVFSLIFLKIKNFKKF